MKKLIFSTAILVAASLHSPAHAVDGILQPISVRFDDDTASSFPLTNLINQSLLSSNYATVGSFSNLTVLGGGTSDVIHNSVAEVNNNGVWSSGNFITDGVLTFDLGREALISDLAFWNGLGTQGVREFEIYADDDDNLNQLGQKLGATRTATMFPNTVNNTTVQIFNFNPVRTRYVHLNILNNHGSRARITAGEVAFRDVPFEFSNLPAMVFLVGVGGLGYFRNKKGR